MEVIKDGFYVTTEYGKRRIYFIMDGKSRYRSGSWTEEEAKNTLCELIKLIDGGQSDNKKANVIYKSCRAYNGSGEDVETYENIVREYEKELVVVKQKLVDAQNHIDNITAQLNQRKAKTCVTQNLSAVLTDEEYYHVVASLNEYYKQRYAGSGEYSVRKAVLERVLQANPVGDNEREMYENICSVLKDAGANCDGHVLNKFAKLGFEVERLKGGHIKVYPVGKPEFASILAFSPSDYRSIENTARDIIKKIMR